jgi:hypothetical protein
MTQKKSIPIEAGIKSGLSATSLPPLLSLALFFATFIKKGLYYKLPPDQRPPVVRIGAKPYIRLSDAMDWLNNMEAK